MRQVCFRSIQRQALNDDSANLAREVGIGEEDGDSDARVRKRHNGQLGQHGRETVPGAGFAIDSAEGQYEAR